MQSKSITINVNWLEMKMLHWKCVRAVFVCKYKSIEVVDYQDSVIVHTHKNYFGIEHFGLKCSIQIY